MNNNLATLNIHSCKPCRVLDMIDLNVVPTVEGEVRIREYYELQDGTLPTELTVVRHENDTAAGAGQTLLARSNPLMWVAANRNAYRLPNLDLSEIFLPDPKSASRYSKMVSVLPLKRSQVRFLS